MPNTFNLIFSGQASTYLYQAEPNETWYFRACALNTHGQRTEFSEEVAVSTVKISDLSNYVESAAIGDALIGELNLGRGWYGELRGNYIDAKQMSVTDGNGKRTLDIDSFGNVSLDVTSLKIQSTSADKFVSDTANSVVNGAIDVLKDGIMSEVDRELLVAKREQIIKERDDVVAQAKALLACISSTTNEYINLTTALDDYKLKCDIFIIKINELLGE